MTNRRKFLVKFTMAAGAATFLRPLNVFADLGVQPQVSTNSLTILHTANLNGRWLAMGQNEKMFGLGGLNNISKKIREIKKEAPSVLLLHSGNVINTHSLPKKDRLLFCKAVTDAGYDSVMPGESDLAIGKNSFNQLANESGLPIIPTKTNSLFTSATLPYHLIKKGNLNIGIINAGSGVHNPSAFATVLNQTAELLRSSKKCDLVICLVQATKRSCVSLAELSCGIDVIAAPAEKASIHNTQIVRNKSNHEVILSDAWAKGAMMSRIDLTFNKKGEKINVASKAIFVGAEDESYAGILKRCAELSA